MIVNVVLSVFVRTLVNFLEPLSWLLVYHKVLVLLAQFDFEGLSLVVHHGDVNDAVSLEARDVEINWRAIAHLVRNGLDVINKLVVFILNRRNRQTHLVVLLIVLIIHLDLMLKRCVVWLTLLTFVERWAANLLHQGLLN